MRGKQNLLQTERDLREAIFRWKVALRKQYPSQMYSPINNSHNFRSMVGQVPRLTDAVEQTPK